MNWSLPLAALCLCLAGIPSGAPHAQETPTSSDYRALAFRSAALSPADKARAQSLFATGFSLWQSGDFSAAELAFKQGLDIDPANALANYYYGDCLARRKDKPEARDYLSRAVALGNGSAESFKAQAELRTLSAPVTDVAEMTSEDVAAALIGTWNVSFSGVHQSTFKILAVNNHKIEATGHLWQETVKYGQLSGSKIELVAPIFLLPPMVLSGKLLSPTHMEGTFSYSGNSTGEWTADKQ